jgi:hypothetical protein
MSQTLDQQIDAAFETAKRAVEASKKAHGSDRGSCGFAWVQIPDGRSQLAKALRARGHDKHWDKGVLVWNPGESNWQNIDVARAGASAFASCFPGEAHAASRLD